MIRFTRDYRGKVTQERFFVAGIETDDFDAETEAYLIEVNAAEVVEDAPAKRGRPKKES